VDKFPTQEIAMSADAAIEPIATQRKRSDGSFAVCCSIDFATDPSACSLLLTDDMTMNELLFESNSR
jgi:hypothetical protein